MLRLVCAFVICKPETRFSCVMAHMMSFLGVIYHNALNIYKPPSDLHILFMLQSDAQNNAIYILQNLVNLTLKTYFKII